MYEIGFNSPNMLARGRLLVFWRGRCAGADTDTISDTGNRRNGYYRNLCGVRQHLRGRGRNVRPDLCQSDNDENRNDSILLGNDDYPTIQGHEVRW